MDDSLVATAVRFEQTELRCAQVRLADAAVALTPGSASRPSWRARIFRSPDILRRAEGQWDGPGQGAPDEPVGGRGRHRRPFGDGASFGRTNGRHER